MGMFPVVNDLLHVPKTVEQEVIPPLRPVHCHGAVFVHAGGERVTQFQHRHTYTPEPAYIKTYAHFIVSAVGITT